jgi:hypothetical protein
MVALSKECELEAVYLDQLLAESDTGVPRQRSFEAFAKTDDRRSSSGLKVLEHISCQQLENATTAQRRQVLPDEEIDPTCSSAELGIVADGNGEAVQKLCIAGRVRAAQ